MKTLVVLMILLISSVCVASGPALVLGVNIQSLTQSMTLSWEGMTSEIERVESINTVTNVGLTPSVTIQIPDTLSLTYTYDSYTFNTLRIMGDNYSLFNQDISSPSTLTTEAYAHRWTIASIRGPVNPFISLENWNIKYALMNEDTLIKESQNRFALSAGASLSQRLTNVTALNFKGAYTFMDNTKGFVLDGALSLDDMYRRVPAYARIGYSYRDVSFASDTTTRFRMYGPYFEAGIAF